MASCNYQILVVLSCALALNACGDSNSTDVQGGPVALSDDQQFLSLDDDGLQADDATQPLEASAVSDTEAVVVIGPEGDSSLEVFDRSFPLDAALGDIWGVQGEHFNINFTLTDGNFTITPTVVDGETFDLLVPAESTAVVYAELFSPGEQFSFVTYSYSPLGADGELLAGNAYFSNAYVGFDVDRSGIVDDDEELSVVGGTVEFTGVLPSIELHFSITLENGLLAQGHYQGLFDFTNR